MYVVRLTKEPKQCDVFHSDYFPRKLQTRRMADALVEEVRRAGGDATFGPEDTKTEWQRLSQRNAERNTLDWYDMLIALHERFVADLKSRRAQFVEACAESSRISTPVDVLSWTVNDVNNVQRNCRLDLAVNRAAELSAAFREGDVT